MISYPGSSSSSQEIPQIREDSFKTKSCYLCRCRPHALWGSHGSCIMAHKHINNNNNKIHLSPSSPGGTKIVAKVSSRGRRPKARGENNAHLCSKTFGSQPKTKMRTRGQELCANLNESLRKRGVLSLPARPGIIDVAQVCALNRAQTGRSLSACHLLYSRFSRVLSRTCFIVLHCFFN